MKKYIRFSAQVYSYRHPSNVVVNCQSSPVIQFCFRVLYLGLFFYHTEPPFKILSGILTERTKHVRFVMTPVNLITRFHWFLVPGNSWFAEIFHSPVFSLSALNFKVWFVLARNKFCETQWRHRKPTFWMVTRWKTMLYKTPLPHTSLYWLDRGKHWRLRLLSFTEW